MHQIFGGGANTSEGVEVVVIHAAFLDRASVSASRNGVGKLVDDRRADNAFEIIEVHHHPIIRLPRSLSNRSTQGDLQAIRVTMRTPALALMTGEMMRRFKCKFACNNSKFCHRLPQLPRIVFL